MKTHQKVMISGTDNNIFLTFVSSFNGTNNLSGIVTPSGSWSVNVELDETETLDVINAELWFEGWVEEFDPAITVSTASSRPSSLSINSRCSRGT